MTTVDFIEEDLGPCPCCVRRVPRTYKKGSKGLASSIKKAVSCFVMDNKVKYFVDRSGHVFAPDQDGEYFGPPTGRVLGMFGVSTETKGTKRKRKKK